MLRQGDIDLVKDVEEYMINLILLGTLAVIDFIKKEIHIFVLIPIMIVWIIMAICNNSIGMSEIAVSILLIGLSLVTKQAFGMADAIVLSLIAMKEGVMDMFTIFLIANILLIVFAVIKYGIKMRNREIPFIPFIFAAVILIKAVL